MPFKGLIIKVNPIKKKFSYDQYEIYTRYYYYPADSLETAALNLIKF